VTQGLVLGADTVVYQKGKIFGKPASRRSAKRMLAQLAGAWHTVYTGLVLAAKPGDHEWSGIWRTRVKMRRLSPQEIEYWSGRHHDKAGAYAAQDRRNPFVEKMRGDFDNVVGLPRRGLRVLLARARRAGYAPSPRPSHLSK
jgi:septum formation protein